CSPTQTSPSSKNSFFQTGTVSLRVSMANRQASKASARWGDETAIITLDSPISSRPMRCTRATPRTPGQRWRTATTISRIFARRRGGGRHAAPRPRPPAPGPPDGRHGGAPPPPRPARAPRHNDLTHLGRGHGRVGLVLEILHAPSPGLLPHHTGEEDEATCPRVPDRGHEALLRQRLDRDLDEVGVRAAADGRKETHLVPLPEDVIGLPVVSAQREQRERARLAEDREAARHRLPGRLDQTALGKAQLDLIAARPFAITGQAADPALNGVRLELVGVAAPTGRLHVGVVDGEARP